MKSQPLEIEVLCLGFSRGMLVGTSAFISAECLFWIGGMILFGLSAAIDTLDFNAVERADDYSDARARRWKRISLTSL